MDTQALKNDIRKKIFAKRKLAHNAGDATETVLLSSFLEDFKEIDNLVDYFDDFSLNLRKKSLNFFLKSVISP